VEARQKRKQDAGVKMYHHRCNVFTCPLLWKKIVIPTCCISVCHSVPLLFGDWSGKPAPVYLPRY
jgi:hypothetical protein